MKTTVDSSDDFERYLRPTPYLDWDSPTVRAFAVETTEGAADAVERAVRLYYAVRDGVRYDPYGSQIPADAFKASYVLAHPTTFCIPKAVLLAAAARAVGVPSRLRFADVRNHLTTPRLMEILRTDLFVFHGFTEMYLEGVWRKATPTFNLSLCEKFRVKPLDWDGRSDAVIHPFDADGRRHMEYVHDYGAYDDVPFDQMIAAWREKYPHLYGDEFEVTQTVMDMTDREDFEAEAAPIHDAKD